MAVLHFFLVNSSLYILFSMVVDLYYVVVDEEDYVNLRGQ